MLGPANPGTLLILADHANQNERGVGPRPGTEALSPILGLEEPPMSSTLRPGKDKAGMSPEWDASIRGVQCQRQSQPRGVQVRRRAVNILA